MPCSVPEIGTLWNASKHRWLNNIVISIIGGYRYVPNKIFHRLIPGQRVVVLPSFLGPKQQKESGVVFYMPSSPAGLSRRCQHRYQYRYQQRDRPDLLTNIANLKNTLLRGECYRQM